MKKNICIKDFCTNPFFILIWIVGLSTVTLFIISKTNINEKTEKILIDNNSSSKTEINKTFAKKINPYPMLDYFIDNL